MYLRISAHLSIIIASGLCALCFGPLIMAVRLLNLRIFLVAERYVIGPFRKGNINTSLELFGLTVGFGRPESEKISIKIRSSESAVGRTIQCHLY